MHNDGTLFIISYTVEADYTTSIVRWREGYHLINLIDQFLYVLFVCLKNPIGFHLILILQMPQMMEVNFSTDQQGSKLTWASEVFVGDIANDY